MARSVRLEDGGAFYHVMARGNRREAIFVDDRDREWFLHTLGEACAKTGWRVHAWVLMTSCKSEIRMSKFETNSNQGNWEIKENDATGGNGKNRES